MALEAERDAVHVSVTPPRGRSPVLGNAKTQKVQKNSRFRARNRSYSPIRVIFLPPDEGSKKPHILTEDEAWEVAVEEMLAMATQLTWEDISRSKFTVRLRRRDPLLILKFDEWLRAEEVAKIAREWQSTVLPRPARYRADSLA